MWRLRECGTLTCCTERAWHDMTCVWYRGAWDVCMTCVRRVQNGEHAAGARSQVNKSRWVKQGVAGARRDIKRGDWVVRSRARGLRVLQWHRTYLARSSIYHWALGAFQGDLLWRWRCLNVRGLRWDMFEVPERLPRMAGATCSCWSTRFGG